MASNHASFDPNNSTTFTETEYKFEQTYGLGKAEGIIGLDTVQMGGFKVQNQIFGVATAVDEQFMRQNNDGIMGKSAHISTSGDQSSTTDCAISRGGSGLRDDVARRRRYMIEEQEISLRR